jgi:hypothetical protein
MPAASCRSISKACMNRGSEVWLSGERVKEAWSEGGGFKNVPVRLRTLELVHGDGSRDSAAHEKIDARATRLGWRGSGKKMPLARAGDGWCGPGPSEK